MLIYFLLCNHYFFLFLLSFHHLLITLHSFYPLYPQGLRDSCERLERNFEILDGTMQDKVNNHEMDRAMHQKYEVIVQYLKDSIKATNEDEQHFEKKIEEFQAAIKVRNIYFFFSTFTLFLFFLYMNNYEICHNRYTRRCYVYDTLISICVVDYFCNILLIVTTSI